MASTYPFSHLVVIGASAGGIDALSTLVTTLPPSFAAPIVIAQHLDPSRPSHLGDILARRSILPVRTAQDQEPLEAGVIYVVPPNHQVRITAEGLTLYVEPTARYNPSIDGLFSSAAQAYGEQVIAIVLSGTGSDGAAGARLVKQAGGTILIQDPSTASFPSMPLALAPTIVDLVAPPERMGALLASLVAGVLAPIKPDDQQAFTAFLSELHERLGLDFTGYKTPTLLRRLQRRILATDTSDLAGYRQYLATHPEEYQQLSTTFLINVTEFFRDADLFAWLRDQIVPDLLIDAQRHGRELRLWSAGCSTGEEAYSLAIILVEALADLPEGPEVRLFATDVDAEAVAFARRGRYPAAALAGVSQERLDRFFTKESGGFYQITKTVRSLLVFGQHDLGQRAAFPQLDMVLCRNVLIYFTPTLQQRVLQLFAYALREGSYLVLGKAESAGALADVFTLEDKTNKIYRRQGDRVVMPPARLPLPPTPLTLSAGMTKRTPGGLEVSRSAQELHQLRYLTEDFLLQLPVGLVVVDRHLDIQAINTTARRALGIHGPAVGEDLLHLAQGLPIRQVQAAIEQSFRTGSPTSLEVPVEDLTTGEPVYLQLRCQPQREAGTSDHVERVLILSYDVTSLTQERQALAEQLQHSQTEGERVRQTAAAELARREEAFTAELERVRREAATTAAQREQGFTAELERVRREAARELAQRKEEVAAEEARLQRELAAEGARQDAVNQRLAELNRQLLEANEELSRANEALRMESEEFVVRTEEAQAVAEEAETLNEEMQATNEERETLNEEFQSTIEELTTTNAELEARSRELQMLSHTYEAERVQLVTSVVSRSAAVVILDQTGHRLLTNAIFTAWFGSEGIRLSPQDARGQPLPPEETPQQRAARGETFRLEFSSTEQDGSRSWFVAEGQPLRGEQGAILGGMLLIEHLQQPPS